MEHQSIHESASPQAIKRCTRCKTSKPLDAFGISRRKKDGHPDHCLECAALDSRESRARRKAKTQAARRTRHYLKAYDLGLDEYYRISIEQEGRCAICQNAPDAGSFLFVDHNHVTGAVRGLLCSNCNTGLGFFNDNPNALEQAARYVAYRK